MEKTFEITELKNLTKSEIEELMKQLEKRKRKLIQYSASSRHIAEERWRDCSAYFLFNDSNYQDSQKYKIDILEIDREIKILEICKHPKLLKNEKALKILERAFYLKYGRDYEFSVNDLNLLISTFSKEEILDNESLLNFLEHQKITLKVIEFLQSEYLQNDISLLEEALYSIDINYKDKYKKFIKLTQNPVIINNNSIRSKLPVFTVLIYENIDVFGNEKIINNEPLLNLCIKELDNYMKLAAHNISLKIDSKKNPNLRLRYLEQIFLSSKNYAQKNKHYEMDEILQNYKNIRVKLVEEALDNTVLKKDVELLFSLLSPSTFIKIILRRREEQDKIENIKDILFKNRTNSTINALYHTLRTISLNQPLTEPLDVVIDALTKHYLKHVNIENVIVLNTIIDKVNEINEENQELINNASRILVETPILTTHPDYIWSLLFKSSINDQNIYEKFMKIEEVRKNFTYNNGNSFYGFLLSLEKYPNFKELTNNYDEVFFKKINEKENIEKDNIYTDVYFKDVFSLEGLKNLYQYNEETNTIEFKSATNIYRETILYVLNQHAYLDESEKERDFSYILDLNERELFDEFEAYVTNHYTNYDIDYDPLAETVLATKYNEFTQFEKEKNQTIYSNPNKTISTQVKKLLKKDSEQ